MWWNKNSGAGFTSESYLNFKELTSILPKLFLTNKKEEVLPNTLYETSITLIPKADKEERMDYSPKTLMNIDAKILKKKKKNKHGAEIIAR